MERQPMVPSRLTSLFLIVPATGVLLWAPEADAEVRLYHYSLDTISGDPLFADEISNGARELGRVFEVETDADGRTLRVATFRDGRKTEETFYTFLGNAKTWNGYRHYTAGEMTGKGELQRNAQGYPSRLNNFTAEGSLTSYLTATYVPHKVEWKTYSSTGKLISHTANWYSDRGVQIRFFDYYENGTYSEWEVDQNTGQSRWRKQYGPDGKREVWVTYEYDRNGEVIRNDLYDSNETWYGAKEYLQGLITREIYAFANGSSEEIRTTYDSKRWAHEAKFSINGKLICTFTYERLPDGTVRRTLALGPGGDLWAEYPDQYVNKINRNGEDIDGRKSIIYKNGDWW